MVFLCWVVCVCLSVSAWPGCLSLPLDAGRGQQLLTLDDDTAKTHGTQTQVHSNTLTDYNTLLPLLRLPQDPHSISLGPIGEGRELFRELSSGAGSSADSSSAANLIETLQQQGLSGPADATGVDLSYEVVDPRLMALLDDLMTQQQQHSQIASVNVANLTFKISRNGNTAKKAYRLQIDKEDHIKYPRSTPRQTRIVQLPSTYINKDNTWQPLESKYLSYPSSDDTLENIRFQTGIFTEIRNPKDSRALVAEVNSKTGDIKSGVKFDDIGVVAETNSKAENTNPGRLDFDVTNVVSETNNKTEDIIPGQIHRVKRSSTTLSIDYSLKILRDTLLQELKRKKKQRILLRRLRENEQQLLNIG